MQNCSASARTSAEIPVSVRGELSLLFHHLCHTSYPLQSFAAASPPVVPFYQCPSQCSYWHTVLQVMHVLWVWGTYMNPFFSAVQVSVLTDQVEAQGEKIRDLEFCLEEHREKLNATEEMLQQVFHRRMSASLSSFCLNKLCFASVRAVCFSSRCCTPWYLLSKW